jgi:hypothetical protein
VAVKYTKYPTSSIARPSKIYPNCYFWSENIPSGNPELNLKRVCILGASSEVAGLSSVSALYRGLIEGHFCSKGLFKTWLCRLAESRVADHFFCRAENTFRRINFREILAKMAANKKKKKKSFLSAEKIKERSKIL